MQYCLLKKNIVKWVGKWKLHEKIGYKNIKFCFIKTGQCVNLRKVKIYFYNNIQKFLEMHNLQQEKRNIR